jgi:tetratricopeptide (TPR) repeat protein
MRRSPSDIDALALSGEVELRARDDAAAVSAWQALSKLESSARASFGLARARFSAGDSAAAESFAKATLERNPRHVGAKILLARIAAARPGKEPEAISWLEQVAKQPELASSEERVSASTLLGDIHIARSRISRAEAAYTDALKINPKAARALIGLGEALYRAGRYSEAQARFEAGAQADPDDVFAKVGVAKSKLMLERLEDANASLKKLRESHPASLLVSYWYGRVLEAVGDRAEAERVYRAGIDKGKDDPLLVDAYIALALLQNQQGRADEAQKTLAAARSRLPASAAIHRALGDVALSQGRYSDAQTELRQAIKLDPEDLGAKFRLGSALRRDRKFDDALAVFAEVAATDAEYPGLALERGLLFEASNRTEEALKAYESALAKAPDDPDLMLRVGCGYATAARTKEAEELLRKVLALRPTSAETNHCLGRALLAEGSRLADALRMLERAVELDPHRPEFHLYVGWAANEAGNVPKAQRELDQAIALDQSLADAYWQRGVLRQRQGVVRDAVQDLTRALQLRPTRYEAHAALADAYYDLGREPLALAEWQKAVAAQPDNATWHFRYGKLLADNHMVDTARAELTLALQLAEKTPRGERWIWEAHHRLARAIGQRPDAVPHWEAFLRLGPLDSPYRAEAKTALEQLGKPWIGN